MAVHNTSSLFDITGKVVLITGATGGLGQTAAKRLAWVGANVMLTARSEDKLVSIVASIVQEGRPLPTPSVDRTTMTMCAAL